MRKHKNQGRDIFFGKCEANAALRKRAKEKRKEDSEKKESK